MMVEERMNSPSTKYLAYGGDILRTRDRALSWRPC